ncbi:hypothetical protein CRE_14477 [Caenorhabditis remanei]|uniref:SCP domain-containing protein n=1 Tax=Caenorhabditis remanei TaxID=31234 RepID=E3M952_CAERE|nr:hypothetical protein CRE_14477 [Caenorhabditis remanei]
MNLIQSLLVFLSFVPIKDSSILIGKKFFLELNNLRQHYANKYNVPNMHKLIWSRTLVDISKWPNWDVSLPKARKTWRYDESVTYLPGFRDIKDQPGFTEIKDAAEAYFSNPYNNTYTMGHLELLNPVQRFIGCGPKFNAKFNEFSLIHVCLVGTEGKFTFFDTSRKSKKLPGSECHKRYKNEGGLCVAKNETEESYHGYSQDIIDDVNRIRKKYSKQFNVPNMHQLIWSDDLLKNLQNMAWNNGFMGARVTWRYVQLDTYIETFIERELSNFFEKTDVEKRSFISTNSDTTLDSLEFLNPLQKFIACGQNSNTPSLICLLGTEGKFTMFDSSGKSKEIPGSNCQKRYRNDSGVCVAIKPEEESYFGRQSDFMSDINQIRRRYAKEYRVPNMHALAWSNELAEILEPLNMTIVRAQAKKTWRYGALNTYDNTIYHIKADVTRFFEMNRTAKNDHIVKTLSDKDTMDRLEFLNPLQKTIACGRKEEEGVTYIICLLGPEGNFTIFDTSFQSQLAAGSKCHKGYYNEDGLCIMQIPTQVPIIDYRKMAEEERNKALTEEPEPEPILENHGNEISLGYLLVFLLAKLFFNI